MAEIPAFITVVGEDAPPDESLPKLMHQLQHRACENAHVAAASAGVQLRPGCSYSSFAAKVNDDIDGDRAGFEAHLRACAVGDLYVAMYLRMWDLSTRPVAIVHVAERVPA